MKRVRVSVQGVTQGLGFRPWVYRLATELSLQGSVQNTPDGVAVTAFGDEQALERLVNALREGPPDGGGRSHEIRLLELPTEALEPDGEPRFRIVQSAAAAQRAVVIPADSAPCTACTAELLTPTDRRYRYPFISCTQCGPRYSIVDALPFERERTSLGKFALCAACATEYAAAENRRFHAQTIGCHDCGPRLAYVSSTGAIDQHRPLESAVAALRTGAVVALKGVGGYQLCADARSENSVQWLRQQKQRPHKPFAVLFESADQIAAHCTVSEVERRELTSPAAPIVVLRQRGTKLANAVAPGLASVGAMLPSSPLHQLLVRDFGAPLVCTSANRSGEPMLIDDHQAIEELRDVCAGWLTHDRDIRVSLDDSVCRFVDEHRVLLRRGRGFAPSPPVQITGSGAERRSGNPQSILALGAQLKNTATWLFGKTCFTTTHLGNLQSVRATTAALAAVDSLSNALAANPEYVVADLHPDYTTSQLAADIARRSASSLVQVQHHHAHVAAVMAEHGARGPVLGFAWDGTGYGSDGTTWGGETLRCEGAAASRVASLTEFALLGGNHATKDPRLVALSLLWQSLGEAGLERASAWFTPRKLADYRQLLGNFSVAASSGRQASCSSVGRLFDGVAALLGLCTEPSFEGQAAQCVEEAAGQALGRGCQPYSVELRPGPVVRFDWRSMIRELVSDVDLGVDAAWAAARFHHTLAAWFARVIDHDTQHLPVVLAGGCFQNAILTRLVLEQARLKKRNVLLPHSLPPNDGAISVGQAYIVSLQQE